MTERAKGPKQGNDEVLRLWRFADSISMHASELFVRRRPYPEIGPETEIFRAYGTGLFYARVHSLPATEKKKKEVTRSLLHKLTAREDFPLIGGGMSPPEFLEHLYRDDRELPQLFEMMPKTIKDIAFLHGITDVYEFAICFTDYTLYKDDFRRIRSAVESSLDDHGLLQTWLKVETLSFEGFTPPHSVERLTFKRQLSGLDVK